MSRSELVAHAGSRRESRSPGGQAARSRTGGAASVRGSIRRTKEVVVGRGVGVELTAKTLFPANTSVEVHVTGEAPVNHERDHVLPALTTVKGGTVGRASRLLCRQRVCPTSRGGTARRVEECPVAASTRTSTLEEEVLTLPVVSTIQVKGRCHRISHTSPERVLVTVAEVEVVVDEAEVVAARREGARHKRVGRVGELDVLISAVEFPRPDRVARAHRKHRVVGDRARDTAER